MIAGRCQMLVGNKQPGMGQQWFGFVWLDLQMGAAFSCQGTLPNQTYHYANGKESCRERSHLSLLEALNHPPNIVCLPHQLFCPSISN